MTGKIAMVFGVALALQAQELTPEQAAKLDAAKKKLAEISVSVNADTFQILGGHLMNGSTVKGQPYSAEAINESTQVLGDGNRIVNRTSSMLYRDSEGRERREESIGKLGAWNAEGAPAKVVFISDPVAKTSYSLDEKSHTASKGPMGMTTVMRSATPGGPSISFARTESVEVGSPTAQVFKYESGLHAPSGTPAKKENLGTQVIEGIAAEGTRETITIPAGQVGNDREIKIVSERWFSPELQVAVISKHSDPRTGETSYRLTNINRAEPMRSLFEVPSDYTISDPMSRVRRVISKDENQN